MQPIALPQKFLSTSEWARDVVIQTTKVLTTTGGTVWDASRRCGEYLEHEQHKVGLLRPGVRVLELGAGCGFLGMLVARNSPAAAEVCLTEQAFGGALDHLRQNVELNKQALPNMGAVTTAACDWSHFMNPDVVQAARSSSQQVQQPAAWQQGSHQQPDQQQEAAKSAVGSAAGPSPAELSDMARLLQTKWDIIIGSDLIYNKEGAHALPRVLAALMAPQTLDPVVPATAAAAAATVPAAAATVPAAEAAVSPGPISSCSSRSGASSKAHCSSNDVLTPAAAAGTCCCGHEQPAQCHQQHGSAAAPLRAQPGSPAAAAAATMYYAHTKHRFDALDVEFFEQLEQQGFTVEEVVEVGREMPPPSPPPFSSLFPDMRIAVFRITVGRCQQEVITQ